MKNKKTPLISVLLPVYNGGQYLSEAIESIINQTVTNWELIIVNDGSVDNSLSIAKKYARNDKRIKILVNEVNMGIAASLNKALNVANGKYIARMDADDISFPNRFEEQVKLLEKSSNLVAVGGQEEIIDENGNFTAVKRFPTNPKACYQTLANIMPIQPPLLMVRGDAFRKYRYDTVLCRDDDIDIYFKLLQEGDFSNVDKVIFQYRQLNSSLTHKKAKAVFYMALKVRLRGILKYGYRPSISRLAILALETLFVGLLPSKLVVKTFEILRYKDRVKEKIIELSPSWLTSLAKVEG